ncbi:MAG TPA: VWA domain-containing protein [Terriglobales bacterium]|jgi:VWFA-related protein
MNACLRLWTFCLFSSLIAFAQQGTSSLLSVKQPATAASGSVDRIALDIVVTDKSGKPISGLQAQDFTVVDDKQSRKILDFHAVDSSTVQSPVEVILVVDEVNASIQSVFFERQQIEKFLAQNGGHLAEPTSLIFFTDAGPRIQNGNSRDGNFLIGLLHNNEASLRAIPRESGVYGAADRLRLSTQALTTIANYEAARPGRKILVWISPGWPLLSGARIQLTSENQRVIFNSVVALSTELRRAGVTIYSIDPLGLRDAAGMRTLYYQQFTKGVTTAKHADPGNLALQVFAYQTGGRVLNSSNDISGEIAQSVTDANAYYSLSFDSLPADGPNAYHAVKVKVDKPGLTARTRTGYYNQP